MQKDCSRYVQEFLEFIDSSPTPYHAVSNAERMLRNKRYQEILEDACWQVVPGQRYYVKRNGSSIIAFHVGGKWKPGNGMSIIGAHTDSPCFRIKPVSDTKVNGYLQVGVETYGGGLWPTWFDRDLSISGRVYVKQGSLHESRLVHIKRPLLRIPTLAIHLGREQGSKLEFNTEDQLEPILGLVSSQFGNSFESGNQASQNGKPDKQDAASPKKYGIPSITSRHCPELLKLIAEECATDVDDIVDFELLLHDTQPAAVGGLHNEFIFSPRLDNLCSSFCAMKGLLDSTDIEEDHTIRVVALFDHEEIGSCSAQGAASNFLEAVLTRIARVDDGKGVPPGDHYLGEIDQQRPFTALAKSFFLSADMAHAVHPNYVSKHQSNHRPLINAGPVIKINANQRYATNSPGVVLLEQVATLAKVPLQLFVVRNDSPCGSTIGPIVATRLGLRTLDIGNPQLSMHSVRETGGTKDFDYCVDLFRTFFTQYFRIESTID